MGKMHWVLSYLLCPGCGTGMMLEAGELKRRVAKAGDRLHCLACNWRGEVSSVKNDGLQKVLVLVEARKVKDKKPKTKKEKT